MNDNRKSTLLGNSLVWFGAGVSFAEILTGTYFAPLGMGKGLLAIVLGHLLGCLLLYGVGMIGSKSGCTSMEATKLTYGETGGKFFAGMNIVQLVGWTAVMIYSGAHAAQSIFPVTGGIAIWGLLITLLILIWLVAGIGTQLRLNIVTMLLLFGLSMILSRLVMKGDASVVPSQNLSFGEALEMSVAMPVSWLPLISDYTSTATKPKATCFASVVIYFLTSCWMYLIGMAAAVYTGKSDVAAIMAGAGLGVLAALIVIMSTVTTTFLDVYSAGISLQSIRKRLPSRPTAIVVCILGLLLAIFSRTENYEFFLYWISSIFVPMATVHLMDQLVMKERAGERRAYVRHFILWLLGLVLYRLFLYWNLPIGSTLPAIAIIALFSLVVEWIAVSSDRKRNCQP